MDWIIDIWHKPFGSWNLLDLIGLLIGIPLAFWIAIRLIAAIIDGMRAVKRRWNARRPRDRALFLVAVILTFCAFAALFSVGK